MKKYLSLIICAVMLIQFACPASAKRVVKEDENMQVNLPVDVKQTTQDKSNLPVDVKAAAAVLMDAKSGEILMEYNPDVKLFPASVTKIMTILLVCEAIDNKKISFSDKVSCSANAASKGGSQIWLEEGESMSVDELFRATVIGSANDAATLLGEYVAGSEEAFIDMMNKRAVELGMKNTHFENATGLDDTTDTHLTTARDIAIMSKEVLQYEFVTDYTTVWMDSLRNGETELVNTNKLVRFFSGTTGLKTGTTAKAGCCVSASAERDGLHLIAVVMGSDTSSDRFETAKAMLNWGFSNYSSIAPEVDTADIGDVAVIGGKTEKVKVSLPEILPLLIKKGEESSLKTEVNVTESVEAPVEKGQTLGSVKVISGEKVICQYKLTAANEVEKLTVFDCLKKLINFVANGEKACPLT